ncbi:hypothetical protein FRC08_001920 [Ceratobasidium sp. 394]|nr:hypothetical protein FRC08_001920 [Ceratobasidium sp. 394]
MDPVDAVHVNAFTSDQTAIEKFDTSSTSWKSAMDKKPLIQEFARKPLTPKAGGGQKLKFVSFILCLIAIVAIVLLHTVLYTQNEDDSEPLHTMSFGVEDTRSRYQAYLRKLME